MYSTLNGCTSNPSGSSVARTFSINGFRIVFIRSMTMSNRAPDVSIKNKLRFYITTWCIYSYVMHIYKWALNVKIATMSLCNGGLNENIHIQKVVIFGGKWTNMIRDCPKSVLLVYIPTLKTLPSFPKRVHVNGLE